jgi:hypothetical protein
VTLIAADDRAYLTVEETQRYALGDPASPLLVFNAADGFGCMWVAEEPPEWAGPTVITPMDRRQDGHGGYAGEPSYDPLTLTVTGSVAAPSPAALRAAHRRLLNAWAGSAPGYVRYTHLDDDPAKGVWVLPVGTPKWTAQDTRYADFSVQVVAEDPIKTGAAVLYGPVRLPAAGGEGGYVMGAAGAVAPWTASGGTVALTVTRPANDGDQDAHAVYTVTGPVPSPRIAVGTGSYVQLAADLAAGDTWVVDTAAGTSTVNGVNRYDAWGAGSTFPLIPGRRLQPDGSYTTGGTEVRLRSMTGGSSQAAGLTVLTAPSWR